MNESKEAVRHRIPHRLLAILLSLSLLVGLLPTQVFALPPGVIIANPGTSPVTPLPTLLSPGQVWTDKSVRYEGEGIFDIQLRVAAKEFKLENPKPQDNLDVVFVLDVSGSMEDNKRLDNLKGAAKGAVSQLLAVEGNRVAIVSYSDWAEVQANFSENASALHGVIEALESDGGTNIQNAYLVTESLLKSREDKQRKPVVILMSDGQPTYYHKSLTSHTSGNRQGEGYPEDTNGDYVWNTILQAQRLKQEIPDVRIFTVGFAVGTNAFAIATLQPTAANTAAYRPIAFSASKRTSQEKAEYQHTSRRYSRWDPWMSWNITNPLVKRNGVVSYSAWESVEKLPSSPVGSLGPVVVPSFSSPKDLVQNGNNRTAYFDGTRSGIEYKDIVSGPLPFEHQYYEPESSLAADGAQAIIDAFTRIVVDLTNVKPFKPNGIIGDNGEEGLTGLMLTDVLGEHFEVMGPLPAGLSLVGSGANRQVRWSLGGEAIPTHHADAPAVDADKVLTVAFKVKLSESAPLGTHYTNQSAQAEFTTHEKNPAYPKPTTNPAPWPLVATALLNNGWLTLEAPDTPAKLLIQKQVVGPVVGTNTFYFQLYSQAEGGEALGGEKPIQIGVTVMGEGQGQGEYSFNIPNKAFDGEGKFTLYVQEVSAVHEHPRDQHDAWTLVKERKPVVFSRTQATATAAFVNQYNPKGTLTVKKVWSGEGPKSTVSFDLYQGQGESWSLVSEGHVIPESGELQLTGLDLGVKYTVRERTPEDYLALYTPHHVIFTTEALNGEITIENAYQRPSAKIKIEKLWNHGDQPKALRPAVAFFKVTSPSGEESLIRVSPDDAGKWETTLESYEFGRYEIEELGVLDYSAEESVKAVTVAASPVKSREAKVTFENSYVPPTASLTVEKKWQLDEGFESFRPETIQLKVIKDGKATDLVVKLPEGDDTPWQTTLEGLPFGTYTVEELSVGDYTPSISEPVTLSAYNDKGEAGLREGYIAVTNTFDKPTGTIAVDKTWVEALGEAGSPEAVRPQALIVTLYKNDEAYQSIVLPKPDGSWEHVFEGLPLDGSRYTVGESAAADQQARLDNYLQTTLYGDGKAQAIVLDKAQRTGTVSLINRYGLGTLTIVKTWDHGDNPRAEQPSSATVRLYRENLITGERVLLETLNLTADQGPVLRYNLPLDANLRYTLEEVAVPFYQARYGEAVVLTEKGATGILTVSNTYVKPTGSLTVDKVWHHGNNPNPATTATIVLYKNGEAVATAAVGSSYTFTGLELGARYTLAEVSVAGYVSTLEDFEAYVPSKAKGEVHSGKATFVNRYIEPVGALKVTKSWVGKVGNAIDISVVRYLNEAVDREFVATATLKADNDWTAVFEGLPLYGPSGATYRYTVQESGQGLALYTPSEPSYKALEADKTVDYALINTYTPEKGELVIEKEWWHYNEAPMKRPPVDSIAVRLIVDGEPEGVAMILSEENGWRVVRSQLSVDKVYSVEELDVPEGFRADVDVEEIRFDAENLEAKIRITNMETYPEPALTIDKSVDAPQRQLVNGQATFNYTVMVKNTGNRTLEAIEITDFLELPEGVTASYSLGMDIRATGEVAVKANEKGKGEGEEEGEGELLWRLKQLTPAQSYTLKYSITFNAPGDYVNTARVSGVYEDKTLSVEDQATVKVLAAPPTSTEGPTTTVPPATTQPPTQPTTQPATEAPTQPTTQPATQPTTQPATSTVVIEDNTVPQGSLNQPPTKPNTGTAEEAGGSELIFNEVVVPQGALPGGVLPQTGEDSKAIYLGLGGLISAIGVYLVSRRRKLGVVDLEHEDSI